jgi:hypothetical protein
MFVFFEGVGRAKEWNDAIPAAFPAIIGGSVEWTLHLMLVEYFPRPTCRLSNGSLKSQPGLILLWAW